MIDEDDIEFDEPVMVVVDEFDTEEEANAAGAELALKGIGATVAVVTVDELVARALANATPDADADADPDADAADAKTTGAPVDLPTVPAYSVSVLEHQQRRAEEALGLAPLEDRPPANPEEVMKLEKSDTNWKLVIAIWFAALIIIPIVGYFATFYIVSR